MKSASTPADFKEDMSIWHCVVFPHLSIPSKTMNAPRFRTEDAMEEEAIWIRLMLLRIRMQEKRRRPVYTQVRNDCPFKTTNQKRTEAHAPTRRSKDMKFLK